MGNLTSDRYVDALRRIVEARNVQEQLIADRGACIDEALDAGWPIAEIARRAGVSRGYLYRNHNAARHSQRNAQQASRLRRERQLAAEQCRREREARPAELERYLELEAWLDGEGEPSAAEDAMSPDEGGPQVPESDARTRIDPRDPHRDVARNPTLGLPLDIWKADDSQIASAVAASLILRNDRVESLIATCSSESQTRSQSGIDQEILEQLEEDRRIAEAEHLLQFLRAPLPENEWTPSERAAVEDEERRRASSSQIHPDDLPREVLQRWRGAIAARERSMESRPKAMIRPEAMLSHPLLDPQRDPLRGLPPEPWGTGYGAELASAFEAARALMPKRVEYLIAGRYGGISGSASALHGLILSDLKQDQIRAEEELWSALSPIPNGNWTPAERAAVEAAERRNAVYIPHMPIQGYAEWRGRIAAKTRLMASIQRRRRLLSPHQSSQQGHNRSRLDLLLPPKPWGAGDADELADAVARVRAALPAFVRAVQQRHTDGECARWPQWKHDEAVLSALEREHSEKPTNSKSGSGSRPVAVIGGRHADTGGRIPQDPAAADEEAKAAD